MNRANLSPRGPIQVSTAYPFARAASTRGLLVIVLLLVPALLPEGLLPCGPWSPVARAQQPITLGEPFSGEITAPETPAAYTFSADEDSVVYIDLLASTNASQLNVTLDDAYGRRIADNLSQLGNLGPIGLMGGSYTLTILSEGAGVGTFEYVVYAVTSTATSINLGDTVDGAVETPGQRPTFQFTLAETTRLFIDTLAASPANDLNYVLRDGEGNTLVGAGSSLGDIGPLTLAAGAYELEVRGENDKVGTFSFRINTAPVNAPQPITLGEEISGAITVAGEQQQYTFTPSADRRVMLDITGTSNSSGLNLRLDAEPGHTVQSWTSSLGDLGPYTLLPVPHTLHFRGEGHGVGTFSVRVVETELTDTPAALDETIAGELSGPGEADRYTYTLPVSTLVTFRPMGAQSTSAFNWSLRDASGRTVVARTNSWSTSGAFWLSPGDYVVQVEAEGASSGTYGFALQTASVDDYAAAVGDTVSGSLSQGDTHRYTFTAPAGQLLTVTYGTSSNYNGLNFRLLDAIGHNVIGWGNNLASSSATALTGGSYTLEVTGETGQQGTYELTLTDSGITSYTAPAGLPLLLDEAVDAVLTENQETTYTLTVDTDSRVFFDLATGLSNLRWTLTDAAGRTLFSEQRARYDYDDRGPYLMRAGDYTLTVYHLDGTAAAYAFTARRSVLTTGTVALDETVVSALAAPADRATWEFVVSEPTRVYFDVLSGFSGLEWTLRRDTGELYFDGARARYDSDDRGPYNLDVGTYTIEFVPTGDAFGSFSFVPRSVVDTTGTAALGDTVEVGPIAIGATHTVEFDLTEATRVYFDVLTGTNNLYWTLAAVLPDGSAPAAVFDGSEIQLATHDRGPYTLPAGTWRLTFNPSGDVIGNASFALLPVESGQSPLVLDSPVTGQLESPGHTRTYVLDLTEPTRVFLDLTDASTGLYAELRDDGGFTRFSGRHMNSTTSDDYGPITLPAGQYELFFYSDGAATNAYGFTMRRAEIVNGGPLMMETLTDVSIASPGDWHVFELVLTDPTTATFDLMTNQASGTRWSLIDPAGTAVFSGLAAWTWSSHDRGPYPLAPGTYTLRFAHDNDATTSGAFRVRDGSVAEEGAKGCAKCSALDVVFVFDTSASMNDNETELCNLTADLVTGLGQQGIPVDATFWGISEVSLVPCISSSVRDELGATVPGSPPPEFADLDQCSGGVGTLETWSLASAIVADAYPWDPDAVRLIVPVGDEGPYCGDPVDALDTASVTYSADIALANNVVVSPIVPDDVGDPLRVQAIRMAEATQGTALVADFDPAALLPAVAALAHAACSTETEAARPALENVAPGAHLTLPAGVPIVLSGRFVPVNPLRPILDVRVGDEPAESLDAGGRFFHPVVLEPGDNTFTLSAVESCGSFQTTVTLHGQDTAEAGFDDYVATPGLVARTRDTTWNPGIETLFTRVRVESEADFPVDGPIIMVIGHDLHPDVSVNFADGTLDDGRPYLVVSDDADVLAPGSAGAWVDLSFTNPTERRVDYSVTWLSPKNHAPVFTSAPVVSAKPNATWTYAAQATDLDGHELTWSLMLGPAGMSVDSDGALQWTPTDSDIGVHDVVVSVADGRGGSAAQSFSLAVGVATTNSPPVFVTPALTYGAVGEDWLYDADATDFDGDPLLYELTTAPDGMAVDPIEGVVTWPFALPGLHDVVLTVSDGQGASAQQAFTLSIGELPANPHAPIITSTPPTLAVAGAPWYYPAIASDPDGDVLTWTLETFPAGMTVTQQGVLTWSPETEDLGNHAVTVTVSDNFGGVTAQSFVLVVTDDAPDAPPAFVTSPGLVALAGVPYTYAPEAIDPEGLAVTFDLPSAPTGASLVDGVITWTPTPEQAGNVALAVRATDAGGNVAHQAWFVNVRADNALPSFGGLPPATEVAAGSQWTWWPSSFDADGDPLTFSLANPPAGASVDPYTGAVVWTPTVDQVGEHVITLVATDPFGGETTQQVTVVVVHDGNPPVVTLQTSSAKACLDGDFQACVLASDDTAVSARSLLVNGNPIALPGGVCAFVPVVGDTLVLEGAASDPTGNIGTDTVTIPVVDCENDERPVVTLESPTPNELVSGPVELVATITDDTPGDLTWTVEVAPDGSDDWELIGSGAGAVESGVVAFFDTTIRSNGTWNIRIVANDGIQTGGIETWLGVSGEYKLGNFTLTFQDARLPIGGIPLTVMRHYDSFEAARGNAGDFGPGWHLSLSASVRDTAREWPDPTAPALVQSLGTEAFTRTTRVEVVRPDGKRVGFTFNPKTKGFPTPFLSTPAFDPDEGVEDELDVLPADKAGVFDFGGKFMAFIIPYNPKVYLFTTAEGVTYRISEADGLEHVEDVHGNTLEVTEDGVTSSLGPKLVFERDEAGRISRIVMPPALDGGEPTDVRYVYDAAGNLSSVTEPTGNATTFHYEATSHPHYLSRIEDPLGRSMIRNVFDDDGRLIGACPAGGDPVTLEGCQTWNHDPVAGSSTYVDTNGNRIDRFYDERGNTVVERRWMDDTEWLESIYVYDEHDNIVLRTDPAGNSWSYTYDALGRQTSVTDASGERTWTVTWAPGCDEHASECDPTGSCTHYTYDGMCNLETVTDALGNVTTWTWNAAGQNTQIEDPVGNTWSMTYNGLGLLASRTDPLGNPESWTYDGRGNVIGRVDRDGNIFEYERDKAGRPTLERWVQDPPVEASSTWNAAGQLTSMSGPDSTYTITYWNTGFVKSIDNAGTPDAPPISVTYGRQVADTLEPGYDGNGNVRWVTDSLGGSTEYQWDALNRLTSIRQSAATDKRVDLAWNDGNQLVSMTRFSDLDGAAPAIVSNFTFDCGGCPTRLVGVRHRRASDNGVINELTLTRNGAGHVTSLTDPGGTRNYVWDGRHRLLGVEHSGGSTESYTYDGVGNRLSSHRSTTMTYSYQSGAGGNRLMSDDDWTYAYDKRGNLTEQIHSASGGRITYEWNPANRLVRATGYDGGGNVLSVVEHTYSWGGRRIRTVVDGESHWFVHDGANPIAVVDDDGEVLVRRLYAHVTDRALAEERDGQLRWLLEDHVGTIVDVVSADGQTVLAHHDYEAFGATDSAIDRLALGYTARDREPVSGLAYHRARWYAPELGRFTSEDPERPWQYEYANNAPLLFTDPSGRVAAIEYRVMLFLLVCDIASAASAGKGFAMTIYTLFTGINEALAAALAGNPGPGIALEDIPPPINEWSWMPCGLGEVPPLLGL